MKKAIQTINGMNREQLATILLDYVRKSNLVNATVTRNRGGKREQIFNESNVQSTANAVAFSVIKKVEEYRNELSADPTAVKRQFEDLPLLIKYFDKAFTFRLRDEFGKATTQKRSNSTEVMHSFNGDDFNLDELHGSWSDVVKRDRKELLDQAAFALKNGLVDAPNAQDILKAFDLYFRSNIQNEKELAFEMKVKMDEAVRLRNSLTNALGEFCRAEMSELMQLVGANKTHWEIGADESRAETKSTSDSEEIAEANNIKESDMVCEVSTVVRYQVLKGTENKGQVEVTVAVQILRDSGGVKEVAVKQAEFKKTFSTMQDAQGFRSSILMEIKSAERLARATCTERQRFAASIFKGVAA
jgi:hypothetical protein